jgi:uncharacterized protein YciI
MGWVIIAFDGIDDAAPGRRAAARDAHVGFITQAAADGTLALGLPLHDEAGRSLGSLMILSAADPEGLQGYLAQEPFAVQGVWRRIEAHPFRIAPLPYAPWPAAEPASGRSHTIAIAWDGPGAEAESRRLAARPAHMARVRPLAADGTLLMGGAILDAPEGRMIGSVAVTRHADHDAAESFWGADPYVTGGVWHERRFFATRFRPLPYRPLSG